jgi:zinc/manganese transport system substrate-binding protein
MRIDNDSHYSREMRVRFSVAAVSLVLVGACSGDGVATPSGLVRVIATTSILGDVVSQLAGDGIELEVLIPAGVDPHDFEPSAQQVASVSSADLVVANGLGLEEGLEDVLAQAQSEGISLIEVGDGVDPLPSDEAEAAGGDEHGAFDPHFWQDPLRMKVAVDAIAQSLTDAGATEDALRVAEYQAEIDATHSDIVAVLGPIPVERRLLVTNHDAFAYFADRYDFAVIGTIVPGGSTMAEPSSAEIAELVATIIANDVPAIFVENIASTGLAEILAEETGTSIEIVLLVSDALGEPGSPTGTYLGMLEYNAAAIADALASE